MPTITISYYVQHKATNQYWSGGNRWSSDTIKAQPFESIQAAEHAALRELPDRREAWTIVPVSDGKRS